jgi:para-nitrobenzyl esterase
VFNNVDASAPINAGKAKTEAEKKEAAQVADVASSAWIAFAKTGRPAAASLPDWEPYTRENGATMVMDSKSSLEYGHDRDLLKLLAPDYQW